MNRRLRRLRSALVAAGAVLVALALTACSEDDSEPEEGQRDEEGEIQTSGEVSVFELQVGDCFNQPESGDVASVAAVPCDEAHDNEVFATFDLEGDEFPGESEVQQEGTETCIAEHFEGYVGLSRERSIYGAGAITPSEQTWEEEDDREVICVAFTLDGSPLEESVEGANQ